MHIIKVPGVVGGLFLPLIYFKFDGFRVPIITGVDFIFCK